MREKNPEKYKQLLERARIASREKYKRIKQNPEEYEKLLEYSRLYQRRVHESRRQLR